MKKPSHHILVCNSFRIAGDAQGACNRKNAPQLIQYLMESASDRGLDVTVSSTGCLNLCAQGPVIVIHPENTWYGGINTEDQLDEILDALEESRIEEKYLIAE